MDKISYKDCGVDIQKGNDFVSHLKSLTQDTFSPFVLGGIGGFSGCFEIPHGYTNPVLCAATDGVGSKLKLALDSNRVDDIGVDLVAMCVNDLICDFAKPLFFLDYYATHSLDVDKSLRIVRGIARGCKLAECSLIGGESAEMPSIYKKGDFDLAGFSVGIAEKQDLINRRSNIKDGDIILGFSSSGFHSNGYHLIQGVIKNHNIDIYKEIAGKYLIDLLLEPTRIYVKEFLKYKAKIKALAHITGGGIEENLIRILPEDMEAVVKKSLLKTQDFVKEITAFVDEEESFKVFNMGVGLIVIVDKNDADSIISSSDACKIGVVKTGRKKVIIEE